MRDPNVLLLIHAFPVGAGMWEPLQVPDGWRLAAPSLPGFDGTPRVGRESTEIDDYARAMLALMDREQIDTAVIGGVSMGGYVSFALWRLAGRRFRGLVLADTKAGADNEQARAGRDKMLDLARREGPPAVASEMLPKLLGETTRARQPEIVARVTRMIERQTTEGIADAIVRLRDRPDATPLLAQIAVPTLVIVGEEDTVTPPSEAESMQRRLPHARLTRISSAGHLSNLENPAAFNAALAGFLSSLD